MTPELQKIYDALPKYVYLIPGKDVWREDDEFISGGIWEPINGPFGEIGEAVLNWQVGRRPIPDHILKSMAFWALYDKMATVEPNGAGFNFTVDYDPPEHEPVLSVKAIHRMCIGLRQFYVVYDAWEFVRVCGGEAEVIKQLTEGPGQFTKWLLGE